MSESKHTSEPWSFKEDISVSGEWFGCGVCDETGWEFLWLEGDPEADTRKARLIAAAPEMYEALCGLANALEITQGPRGVLELVPQALESARAALAKAEGRS